jgi:hypothetical protein
LKAEKWTRSTGILPPDYRLRYRRALAEFDRLWETGESKRLPQRMRELLLVIEACENVSHEVVIGSE